jgi:signal transduction histidine kinase
MSLVFSSQKKLDLEVAKRTAEMCDQIMMEMGAELHDDLIQKLSIFRLYIDRLERAAHNPAETESLLISMRTDFEGVVHSIRRISRNLLPEQTVDVSLRTNVELLCKSMERTASGSIYFECSGDEYSLPTLSQTYLYRIIQELVHNAFKHSAAWHIWVRMKWEKEQLTVVVEDDGSGFHKVSDFVERLRKKNNTLKIRSQAIGATVDYEHGDKGLRVIVTCPYS